MSALIYKKMNEVMKAVGSIGKDQTNTAQGFKFRGIDQFVNALYPALTAAGVFMTADVLERTETIKDVIRSNGKPGVDKHVALRVKYTFHAEDGSSVYTTMAAEGLDSGDKATNKALSAALKYTLIQTFSVPTVDMEEGDRTSPEMGATAGKDVKVNPVATKTDKKFLATTLPGATNPPVPKTLEESAATITKIAESMKDVKSNGSTGSFRKSEPSTDVKGWDN